MDDSRSLLPVPSALVDSSGHPQFGVFAGPLPRVNLEDAHLTTGPFAWPRVLRRFRLKEWQHFLLVGDGFFFGLAAVDTKFLKLAWSYLVERGVGPLAMRHTESPFHTALLPPELLDGHGRFVGGGFDIAIHNHLAAGYHTIAARIEGRGRTPGLEADLRLQASPGREPLVVALPLGGNAAMYSHKEILPVEGELRIGPRRIAVRPESWRAIVDVHRAHYPYRTWWRWATFAGRDVQGREIGINLTDNVALHPARFNECAFWLDGKLHRLAPARFVVPAEPLRPWSIGTVDGAVRLTFHPEGERAEKLELGLAASAFHQPYGRYEGDVELPTGERVRIAEAGGVAEDHVTRW